MWGRYTILYYDALNDLWLEEKAASFSAIGGKNVCEDVINTEMHLRTTSTTIFLKITKKITNHPFSTACPICLN